MVGDEATFLAFAQALAEDRLSDAGHWKNRSIEDFLEAATASSWQKFATFPYCGKIYDYKIALGWSQRAEF